MAPDPPGSGSSSLSSIETSDAVHAAAYRGAVSGADAYHGVMLSVRTEAGLLRIGNRFIPLDRYREIAFVGAGTASVSQALALNEILGDRLTQGFLAGPMPPPSQLPFRSAVRPLDWPGDPASDAARASIRELAEELPEPSLLIVLLSAGALGILSAPPAGFDAVTWRQWLVDLHQAGASGAELSRVVRVVGDGLVGGGLARAAQRSEVATLLVERGDGASVGGGPTRAVTDTERREVAALLERLGVRPASLDPALRRRLEPDPLRPGSLPPSVARPVATAGPADALSGAAGAVGERRYMPRLAGLYLPGPPEQVARTFIERIRTMSEQYREPAREARRLGLVAFAMTTFGLPEGVDERPVMARWLTSVMPEIPENGSTVAVLRTAGGEGPAPPGLVADKAGHTIGLAMPPGVTDAGVLLLARIPLGGAT